MLRSSSEPARACERGEARRGVFRRTLYIVQAAGNHELPVPNNAAAIYMILELHS